MVYAGFGAVHSLGAFMGGLGGPSQLRGGDWILHPSPNVKS